ncbi:hypothetical protein F0L68_21880 [Solihabitans fulvus]|uniref:Bulb-type lectin domain-containing protein n=1 Tax=Solihabitans fulvus TaxID=1892852 RepID=A0A5B2X7S6_9PSEU|nr:hypothetical protein [Solihabitans fulvus]KAA2259161.1 hypothetical protein F0L68_21880 [Solihabitans fulvus]
MTLFRTLVATALAGAALVLAPLGIAGAATPGSAGSASVHPDSYRAPNGDFVMQRGDVLWRGGYLVAGCNTLSMQGDGNLVDYHWGNAVWATDSYGRGSHLSMQSDGNLVEYDDQGRAVWAAGTQGSGDHFTIQTDGNLVVYRADNTPVWSAGTFGRGC